MMNRNAIFAFAALFSLAAGAGVKWYAVDPMGEVPYMPDKPPAGGEEGAPIRIVAAKGEYEPGSVVLVADMDMGKVKVDVGDLRNEKGDLFPKAKLDLKTVKVWYQCGNAWTSYFGDPGLRLCPELLLNDEDLVKVDTKKGFNYARLTEADGTVHYQWLNAPNPLDSRKEGLGWWLGDIASAFCCMKPNFADAATHKGVTLDKGVYKQLFITANVTKDTKPGLYKGEVKVEGRGAEVKIPLALRVLDFELPEPCCYFDAEKPFNTWFCEYVGADVCRKLNGGDEKLAERQIVAILSDFVRHGEILPGYHESTSHPEWGKAAGMAFDDRAMIGGNMKIDAPRAEMRYDARRKREELAKKFGPGHYYCGWGDEYGLHVLKCIRDMVKIYHDEGFRFPINSGAGYDAAGYLADIWWPPVDPDATSSKATFKYNQLGGDGYFGWYACQHVGNENPAFCRRQYGFGPYRAGLSCNFNYAHHLQEWNDIGTDYYKPMMFVYGIYNGCVDTIQWEGFREGLDDIRYATKLKRLAEPLVKGNADQRYAAKKALQLLADADGDNMDLTTLRLEMIRHIEKLIALGSNR